MTPGFKLFAAKNLFNILGTVSLVKYRSCSQLFNVFSISRTFQAGSFSRKNVSESAQS